MFEKETVLRKHAKKRAQFFAFFGTPFAFKKQSGALEIFSWTPSSGDASQRRLEQILRVHIFVTFF